MTLYELITYIENVAKTVPNMGTVFRGDVYDVNNKQDVKYPCFVTTQKDHTGNTDEETMTYGLYLFTFDRLTDDEENMLDVQSHSISILKGIVGKLEEVGAIINSAIYHTYKERFNDVTSGAYVDLSLTIDFNECGFDALRVGDCDEEIERLEDEVKNLNILVNEKDQEIEVLNDNIKNDEIIIQELTKETTEKTKQIEELERRVETAYTEGYNERDSLTIKETQLITQNGTYNYEYGAENIEVNVEGGGGGCEEIIEELEATIEAQQTEIERQESSRKRIADNFKEGKIDDDDFDVFGLEDIPYDPEYHCIGAIRYNVDSGGWPVMVEISSAYPYDDTDDYKHYIMDDSLPEHYRWSTSGPYQGYGWQTKGEGGTYKGNLTNGTILIYEKVGHASSTSVQTAYIDGEGKEHWGYTTIYRFG